MQGQATNDDMIHSGDRVGDPRPPPRPPDWSGQATEEWVIEGPGYAVGEFHCPPGSSDWRRENDISGGHTIVFPGTAVEIVPADRAPVVANPNHTIFYNLGQTYYRQLLNRHGDHCIYIRLAPEDLLELIEAHDPRANERWDTPFPFTHGPLHAEAYLRHLQVHRALFTDPDADPLAVHETVLGIAARVIGDAYQARGITRRPRRPSGRDIDVVREIQRTLSLHYADPLTLDDLAQAVELSASYLARIFRRHTGTTIHVYRNQLRLAAGLRRMRRPERRLVDIAMDVGYSSHSHFTAAFRRSFGVPPLEARRRINPRSREIGALDADLA